MRLKRIKLAGFKSFVEPTSIPFPGSMTAVVGPNGCGKSNVIDAVRWVLGESSAKNLRGDAMTDVIFNGSSSRKPLGQCSVELIFENASERLSNEYAKYEELSIKRVVTREAQSNYFLNGTKCRRKDITDLFLGTGLGPRSYAIIEQGMISRLIESKPQELRVFIEEAAGISKYKERRRETENRIKHTSENLERLSDVRGELGQQIEKLERQAAAAERYTQLKAKERTLKSELAMLRYLAMQHKVDSLQSSLSQVEAEYEALKAQLQGDEAGLEKIRSEQLDTKIQLDKVQQGIFDLATQITRVEEARQFKHKRLEQLQSTTQQLHVKQTQCREQKQQNDEVLALACEALASLEPEMDILTEQHASTAEQRDSTEDRLRDFNQQRRNSDESYHTKKRHAQSCHSQIQSTLSMQMRTQQRLKELKEELNSVSSLQLEEECEGLAEQVLIAQEQKQNVELTLIDTNVDYEQFKTQRQNEETVFNQITDKLRQQQAKLTALEALQNDDTTKASLPPVWQTLNVSKGAEHLIELVLSHLGEPGLLEEDANPFDMQTLSFFTGQRALLKKHWVTEKPEGTLAEKIGNTTFPAFFVHIHIVDGLTEAKQKLNNLKPHESVITEQGQWISRQWAINGPADSSSGSLQRKATIIDIQKSIEKLTSEHEKQRGIVSACIEKEAEEEAKLNTVRESIRQIQAQLSELTQKQSLLSMQVEQINERRDKIHQEIEQHNAQLEQEQEQSEQLSEQLEQLETDVFELEQIQQQADEKMQALQQDVEHYRHQYEQITQQKHQLSLRVQQQQSAQQQGERDALRLETQYKEYTEQLETLNEEQMLINGTDNDNSDQLQQWLQDKQQKEQEKTELQQVLSELDDTLHSIQQGQQGIRSAIEEKQKVRESVLLESEGVKARANAILDQLQETGMSIKETMAAMPDDAEEEAWAAALEKTTNAVKRIGAVNLAAVDEFKVQSERKSHLDAQDADLNEALETLQSAIRKIDKETRSRFSQTFDQVNADLQTLFPKVFGGGSAYLALTDDDLLETGVTIMARPPGKKNSTIHLLSGGEKALTALSLVFAIFRLNPAPFCLLDEVDAPLDDANVGRFCKLVSEMSQSVQFIYITHNKIAMEMASHLTGVTMAEPGVSRMVAVDVEEAVSLVQA
jgi:chromosome segregation protein